MITQMRLKELERLIETAQYNAFYSWSEWKALRSDVLKMDNNECQICKNQKHRYRKATIVHHVKHLKDRPDLALSIYDPETGDRQLLSVCKECHEELHPESQRQFKNIRNPVTFERWD